MILGDTTTYFPIQTINMTFAQLDIPSLTFLDYLLKAQIKPQYCQYTGKKGRSKAQFYPAMSNACHQPTFHISNILH